MRLFLAIVLLATLAVPPATRHNCRLLTKHGNTICQCYTAKGKPYKLPLFVCEVLR